MQHRLTEINSHRSMSKCEDFCHSSLSYLNKSVILIFHFIGMRFQVLSDLHLEQYDDVSFDDFIELDTGADCLLIAGDLGYPSSKHYHDFLRYVSPHYKNVCLIAGNHEFYTSSIDRTKIDIRKVIENFDNVHFLDNTVLELSGEKIAILGTTLWSHIPNDKLFLIKNSMNDYQMIDNFSPVTSRELHKQNVQWLMQEIGKRKTDGWKVVILTHHLMSNQLVTKKYACSPINVAFMSNLESLMDSTVVKLIISGHTHQNIHMDIQGVLNVVNPFGYENENTKFNRGLCVEVE